MSKPDSSAQREDSRDSTLAAHRVRAEIVESTSLPGNHHRLVLSAKALAAIAHPGQFIHVWCHPPDELDQPPSAALLRRPYSISRIRPQGHIEILLRVRGTGGRFLAGKSAGEALDVIGPLGHGFRIPDQLRCAVLVAGGIGLAPMPLLVETLVAKSVRVILCLGAAADDSLPYEVRRTGPGEVSIPELLDLGGEVHFVSEATDGRLVSELVEEQLPRLQAECDMVMAVGPRAMLKHLVGIIAGRVPFQVSLEERMACGVGACRSCVVPAADGSSYVTVCRDGPVFNASAIDWERLTP
ncbi:MAG: dihydroorotate dehydrogenase electron transfer subunit [Armatimonadetes bacterium]|nr:dihydroorotate dehydrogenase electron transfer subunit [Armatimonadota bacterium]